MRMSYESRSAEVTMKIGKDYVHYVLGSGVLVDLHAVEGYVYFKPDKTEKGSHEILLVDVEALREA